MPKEKETNIVLWVGLGIVALVVGIIIVAANSTNTSTSSGVTTLSAPAIVEGTNNALPSTNNNYSQHSSDYIASLLYALSSLYQSTQSYVQAQKLFGSSDSSANTILLTSLGENINYLQSAHAALAPYTSDSDKSISATASLLSVDILTELNVTTQMKASYTYAVQNQDINTVRALQTQTADLATAKNTLENDLGQSMQIIKYIIENTSDNPHPTGQINYLISPENRAQLEQQITTNFPTPLDHAAGQSNVYLLWVRAINLILTANTYEQQATVQI